MPEAQEGCLFPDVFLLPQATEHAADIEENKWVGRVEGTTDWPEGNIDKTEDGHLRNQSADEDQAEDHLYKELVSEVVPRPS